VVPVGREGDEARLPDRWRRVGIHVARVGQRLALADFHCDDSLPISGGEHSAHRSAGNPWRTDEVPMTRLLGDAQRGAYVEPAKLSFSKWVEKRWLPSLSVRESTRHSYTRNLRTHVLPRLGSVSLQKITPIDLNTLYRSLSSDGNKGHRSGEGLSPRTVRYIHTIIGRALGDAVLENLLTVNPAQRATPPRAREATEAAPPLVTWSGPQLARFLDATSGGTYGQRSISWRPRE